MTYQEHGMWEVLEVLRRLHRGERKRAIERATGRARKAGWIPGQGEPDETLAAQVAAQLRPGPREAGSGEAENLLVRFRERLKGWIVPDNPNEALTLAKTLILLRREGVEVSYSTLYRFAVREFGFGSPKPTVRMADTAPGELAEVDFGRLGLISDSETGRKRVLYALIVVLVFSRHQYVHLTHNQKIPDVIDGLENAWEFFGGVTARVVIDNMKAAVARTDRYDPVFQRTFEEYARYRGFVIDAAVPVSTTPSYSNGMVQSLSLDSNGEGQSETKTACGKRCSLCPGELLSGREFYLSGAGPGGSHPLVSNDGGTSHSRNDQKTAARSI